MPNLFRLHLAFSHSLRRPGLISAYGFNEDDGSTVYDSSGYGNTGTIHGATWTTSGQFGTALSFNGNGNYIDLGQPASFKTTGSMTWSAWVRATGNPSDDGQIVAQSNDNSGWQFKTSPDTGPRTFAVAVSPNSSSLTQRYSKTVLALNTWYYVAGVYNAAAQTLDIYVNGVLDDGALRGTVPGSQFTPSINASIGQRSGGYYFNGTIDEVRIYGAALTAAQIQSDMNTPVGTSGDVIDPFRTGDPRVCRRGGVDAAGNGPCGHQPCRHSAALSLWSLLQSQNSGRRESGYLRTTDQLQ